MSVRVLRVIGLLAAWATGFFGPGGISRVPGDGPPASGRAVERPASSEREEVRGLWTHFDQVIRPDPAQGRQDIKVLVDRMTRAHLNLLLPWVRSEYLAALKDPAFPKDTVHARLASWDALAELIEAAHRRGIQTHLWYSFTYYKSPLCHEFRTHPEWAARRLDEIVPDPKTGKRHPPWMTDVCNMHPGARQLELDLVGFYLCEKPVVAIGVWCINYNNRGAVLFDDVYLGIFPTRH